jgi:hypothetical protein
MIRTSVPVTPTSVGPGDENCWPRKFVGLYAPVSPRRNFNLSPSGCSACPHKGGEDRGKYSSLVGVSLVTAQDYHDALRPSTWLLKAILPRQKRGAVFRFFRFPGNDHDRRRNDHRGISGEGIDELLCEILRQFRLDAIGRRPFFAGQMQRGRLKRTGTTAPLSVPLTLAL